jgi:hypothetical protein
MSWSIARPSGKEPVEGTHPLAELGLLLGASAVSLVVLGILSLLEAKDLEPFGGSVPVLAGLLAGSALVVAGLTGVSRRQTSPTRERTTDGRELLETRSVDAGSWPVDGARHDWVGVTRMMRAIETPPPPPPRPPPPAATAATAATGTSALRRRRTTTAPTNSGRGAQVPGDSSSRTSA